jgi:hypothetical protein
MLNDNESDEYQTKALITKSNKIYNTDELEFIYDDLENQIQNNIIDTIDTIKIKKPEELAHECPICFEIYNIDNIVIFDCKHFVCIECLEKLYLSLRKKQDLLCPMCRNLIEKHIHNKNKHNTQELRVNQRIPRNNLCYGSVITIICIFFLWLFLSL